MEHRQYIIEKVKQLAGNTYLYWDTALVVKKSPHHFAVKVWAICISPKDEIYLMDSEEEFFELEETDDNYSMVLASVYQRVKTIFNNYHKATA